MIEDCYKEVYFGRYCRTCKHAAVESAEEPCNECLEHPINNFSHKPVNYEEKKDK